MSVNEFLPLNVYLGISSDVFECLRLLTWNGLIRFERVLSAKDAGEEA